MKLKIGTVAADDDYGTRATVHLTQKEAYELWMELQFSGELSDSDVADKAAVQAFIEHEDYDQLWEWQAERELGNSFDTYAIDEHEIEVPLDQIG